jgi:hypothetical protein
MLLDESLFFSGGICLVFINKNECCFQAGFLIFQKAKLDIFQFSRIIAAPHSGLPERRRIMKIVGLLVCSLLLIGAAFAQSSAPQNSMSVDSVGVVKGTCNCYWSSDCSTGSTCGGYGNCTASGKLDGTCSTVVVTSSDPLKKQQLPMPKQDPAAVYAAVDGYFQAFIKAVNKGGGQPDAKLVAAAQKAMPSKTGLDNIEYAVWVSMDAVMGWDFMYPNKWQRATGYVGNIRQVHGVDAATGIVDATRRGLLDAVQSGDSTKVAAPLQEFWAKNPDFMPRHTGRCYPHGHDEVTTMQGTVACQIDTLQRVATMLIQSGNGQKAPRNEAAPGGNL